MPLIIPTLEISTGNVATVNDPYDTTKFNNGALNPLGAEIWVQDSSFRWQKYQYVRLNTGTAPAHWGLSMVYWLDNKFQSVSVVGSEGFDDTNLVAGFLLNTDAKLTNGNYVFIQTAGYLAGAVVAASTAIGDSMIGKTSSATASISAVTITYYADRTATGTASVALSAATALTAITSGLSDVYVHINNG